MKYRFNVTLTEQDYFEYNEFILFRSPYNRKSLLAIRIAVAVIVGVLVFMSLFGGGFSADSFIEIIPYLIILLVFELLLKPFMRLSIKGQIKSLRKTGKLPYSPEAVVELYDDKLVEVTDHNKTEFNYSAVERVSVIARKIVYIHINSALSFLIPASAFESCEQLEQVLEFLSSTGIDVERYQK